MQTKRNPTVDLLRGIAILLVLLLHFHLTYHLSNGVKFLKPIFNNGNYGVVMFFVISGFLITSTTLKRFGALGNIKPKDFYSFRVGRIAPNILLMLAIIVPLGLIGIPIFKNDATGPSLWLTVLSVLTFTHNLLMEKYGYFNYCLNILWSLSVEEVFYLVFPLICLLPKRGGLALWGLCVFVSPIYRFVHRNDSTDIFGLYDYLACFDGLAIGCLVAIAKESWSIPKWVGLPAGILIAIIYYQGIWSHLVLGISAVSLLTGIILLGAGDDRKGPAALRFLGKYSYELYLFHIIILAFMRTAVKEADLNPYTKLIWLLLFLASSAATAVLISKYYSEPLNRKIRARNQNFVS
jgi:peptidoglycan/LPS O-acetylase OafA/YrhL